LVLGDVAYYDEEGYTVITDRLKELIKVKGFQVINEASYYLVMWGNESKRKIN